MTSKVVVVGAGVIGLTTALQLKRANPDYSISIVAHHLPGDLDIEYTSPFAGANWHSFASKNDRELQELDKPGYWKFLELSNEPRSGVWITTNKSYVTEVEFNSKGRDPAKFVPWFKNFVKNFKTIENSSELPDGIAFGYSFDGVVISVPIYLNYLLQENLGAGNSVRRISKISNIHEARDLHSSGAKADIVVNATGGLANRIVGFKDDKRNFPVRGQVLLVRNNAKCEVSVEGFPELDNEMLYLMPRKEGGCIIGGCFLENFASTDVDEQLTKRIIDRALKYVPEIVDPSYKNNPPKVDIVRTQVGLRPFREGGARIEQDSDNGWLFHNYGAGGGGYQGSYGMSSKLVELIQKHVGNSKF
ncbi:D-amino acid oxidase [Scheffersomyces stipitis CBS 6054]|uniref:D-amino acid oxidase n=1 Tax=Scheffersomyces stipitis (strain ATCC 58785 / CBS 6054 / NBRC 10063 / NRRL Y-11545) TaxID=322104 RepID=A3LRE1_PICST|nr:D-amino acid oxidase [Scheffersomyces stipitis CBS 6054]ABN65368.2 D-amino acid oxidase [Scheffersomyces stipitis CBS 6054]